MRESIPQLQTEPHVMRGKVRRACRYFKADLDALSHYIDLAAEGCGGDNDFTNRARDCLQVAQRAMYECLEQYGRKAGESRSPAVNGNPKAGRTLPGSMPESSCSEELEL
jgi:hypothetical protein